MITAALANDWWMGLPQQAEPNDQETEFKPTLAWCLVRFLIGVLIGMIVG